MTVDWETAVVNDKGTTFAFLDSGAPTGETYTTVVCIHGHSFHARSFEPLFPFAASHNLRIIALNRRDYVGTSLFSQAELDAINGSDSAVHASFLQDRALEIAQFMVWLVNEKNVPKASGDGKSGGLAVLGWSLGNVFSVAFLRHLTSFPVEVKQVLSSYMRTGFLYESAYSGLGYPKPEGAYQPLTDPSIPERMRGVLFGTWVSSYFNHPYYSTPSDTRVKSLSSLQLRTPEPDTEATLYKRPTIEVIPGEELKTSVDTAPDARSERPYWAVVKPSTLYGNTLGTFIRPSEPESLQSVKISVIYCLSSVWSAQWVIIELERDLEKRKAEGKELRQVSFVPIEGGNHFVSERDTVS
ncbi:hypothetical protein SCHPADRAFT_833106 [Schizopora paradoxa]|uniref:AB hydrolase-1 domain-containing protein n=1 Tax=Schizopora paradoxa TaxID=27342 RepID=A0A0H2RZ64_9AGAM|nr:hypothetical protein SCHPADRAFT_833106 [Schizopora paradoxa]